MFILNLPTAHHACTNHTIESFVQDERAKIRFRNDLLPINGSGKRKPDFKFVLNVVEQFAEAISKRQDVFVKSSFLQLAVPFSKVVAQVLQLNPKNVAVQATTTPGIYIFSTIDGQNLHIDLNFSEETGKFEEAIVNIFEDKTQRLNVFGSVDEVLAEIQNYFEPQKDTYEDLIRTSYAIPGQTYTTWAF
jgi:hypothetical protein